jgi:hypothetical protein
MPELIIPQTETTNHAQDYWKVAPQKYHDEEADIDDESDIEEEHWKLVRYKGHSVHMHIFTFDMLMMIVEGFSFAKAANEFGYTKAQLRKKLRKLKIKHLQNSYVSPDILVNSNLK